MTEYSYDTGQGAPVTRNATTLAHWAGAVVSLSLIAGVGFWGYKLVSRDVSGVPVVLAMEGPMRVTPDEPGGRLADHLGLAVNAIAGRGVAEGPADRLVIASRPAGLSEEDVAQGALREYERLSGKATDQAETRRAAAEADAGTSGGAPRFDNPLSEAQPIAAAFSADDAVIPPDSPLAQSGDPAIRAMVAQLTEGAVPLSAMDADDAFAALDEQDLLDPFGIAPEAAASGAPDGPGLNSSLRPQRRPVRVAALTTPNAPRTDTSVPGSAIAEALAMGTEDQVKEIAPDELASGTRLVQIGAFDSAETARREWDRLMGRFDAYLGDKDRVVQQAQSGGRTFYRLRAHGFEDLSDARRFCAAFVAEGVDCIPVVSR